MGGLFSKKHDKKPESRVTEQDRAVLVYLFSVIDTFPLVLTLVTNTQSHPFSFGCEKDV